LPSYAGEFDPKAYIDWELKVDNEFDKHDLYEKQKIYIASNVLTKHALLEWKHICSITMFRKHGNISKCILEMSIFQHITLIVCLPN
jgi:hypothetical protein